MADILCQIKSRLLNSDSILSDGLDTVSYKQCGELVLTDTVQGNQQVHPIPARNRITEAIQVVSHLVNQRNFFVFNGHSGQSLNAANLPVFCQSTTSNSREVIRNEGLCSNSKGSTDVLFNTVAKNFNDGRSHLVLRTSGTTSEAKFVLHDVKSVLKNSQTVADTLGLSPDDTVLIPAPIHHSYGLVTAFFPALIAGCSIRLVDNTNVINLLEAMRTFRPTVMFGTPGILEMLVSVKTKSRISKVTLTAGDRIKEDVFVRYETQIGKLLNLYGSTEMGAMGVSLATESLNHRAKGAIMPLPGMKFKLQNTACGQIGILQCKNASGYRAYLNWDGEITGTYKPNEWFDTKDLGREIGGEVSIQGRSDHKINRNGVLLSYFEIENAVESACQELKKVAVVGLSSTGIVGRHFVAICEVTKNSSMDKYAIRRKCLRNLDRSMVPDTIEVVGTIPRLPNGKVNRVLLQKMYEDLILPSA